jgi:acetylornithine deacetylase/succinyl-diaminopimelate desuccinylase-like protein
MENRPDPSSAVAAVNEHRILELEQRSIKIPSSTFEEGKIADLYANALTDIGLDVEMMEVVHPYDST